jgi:WD40 repeat protein
MGSNPLHAVCFSPDSMYVISGSYNGSIDLWDVNTGNKLRTFKGHSEPVLSLAFSHTGTQIISGSLDSTVRLWNAKTGSQLKQLKGHLGPVNSVSFSQILHASSQHPMIKLCGFGVQTVENISRHLLDIHIESLLYLSPLVARLYQPLQIKL